MNQDIFRQQREKNIATKAIEFFTTILSGRTTLEIYNHRLEICKACEHVTKKGDYYFCTGCGCPKWRASRLNDPNNPKLGWKGTVCPLYKFGGVYAFSRLITTKEAIILKRIMEKTGLTLREIDKMAIDMFSLDELRNLVTMAKKAINANLVPTVTEKRGELDLTTIDWNTAEPKFDIKDGLTPAELSIVNQKMTEAIANEKWNEGFMFAVQVLFLLRP